MRMTDLLKKARIEDKEFLTADDIKLYCKQSRFNYDSVVKYLEEQKHLVRIFRGIFYVPSGDERRSGSTKYNHLELVSKGLELKGVKNWHYGLHTALKINNMTHEYFVIDEIINDTIFRQKPITIVNRKFRFVKITESLLRFGIKKRGIVRYSDPEKTILDFIYLWKANGKADRRIIMDISEWTTQISKSKIKKYSTLYPKSVQKIIDEIV